jgi:CO/xanthine dehydrogenase FAD-binding subunit
MVATFEYRAPTTIADAITILTDHGDDAKVLAGGQSLLPLINLGLAWPGVLVDINRVEGLDFISQRDGTLAIGALTRHATAERSAEIRRACPLLADAVPLIGDRQVRNRGTIGGSLAHADAVAELPTVAACLEAVMVVQGAKGSREIPASEFFQDYLATALRPGEILTEVRFPACREGTGVSFQELVRRKGDFAIVAAAATATLDGDGLCEDVQLALAGVGPTPINVSQAARGLVGKRPAPDLIREAANAACEGIAPPGDVLASAEYRRAMAPIYARRALTQAFERVGAPG